MYSGFDKKTSLTKDLRPQTRIYLLYPDQFLFILAEFNSMMKPVSSFQR